jgi:hypothetical protein
MMARTSLFLAATLVLTGVAPSVRAQPDAGRFALLVGSNLGDRSDPVLRHADSDATRLAQTLRLMGGFPADQVVLITGATASEMHDALIQLNARVREHKNGVLVVFYSGHGDEQSLHLSGTRLATAELKTLLVGSPAASRLLIVDACRSGSLVQLKGAHPAPAFAVPAFAEPVPEGFAVLTSSAASEDSQESAALASSYFTYYVNSGLIGAADQDHDGAVTLSELFAFASAETRAATTGSLAGQQNPTFQFALGGQHDLVLTRPGRRDARMGTLEFAEAGRYIVQLWDAGVLAAPMAELAAQEPGAKLALPPGHYHVTRRGQRDIAERDTDVTGGENTVVAPASMSRVDLGRVVRKGDIRRSATGFAVAAGWRTDELVGNGLFMGSGPTLLATLRHDRRHFSLEARMGLEREVVSNPSFQIENLGLSLTAAALLPIDFRTVTLAFGVEAGWVLVRQNYSASGGEWYLDPMPATPELMHPRWSDGVQLGPLAQLDFPLGEKAYLRFEAAFPYRFFNPPPALQGFPTPAFRGAHLHLVVGAGFTF